MRDESMRGFNSNEYNKEIEQLNKIILPVVNISSYEPKEISSSKSVNTEKLVLSTPPRKRSNIGNIISPGNALTSTSSCKLKEPYFEQVIFIPNKRPCNLLNLSSSSTVPAFNAFSCYVNVRPGLEWPNRISSSGSSSSQPSSRLVLPDFSVFDEVSPTTSSMLRKPDELSTSLSSSSIKKFNLVKNIGPMM